MMWFKLIAPPNQSKGTFSLFGKSVVTSRQTIFLLHATRNLSEVTANEHQIFLSNTTKGASGVNIKHYI